MRAGAVAWALLIAGCGANTPTYYGPPMGPIEAGAMNGMNEVATTVVLPFRAPTDSERDQISQQSSALGFKVPWLRRDRIGLSIQYSITNLADKAGTAQVLVDGASEFASYDRAAVRAAMAKAGVRAQDQVVLSLVNVTPVSLGPGETRTGVVREDELAEAELDLDAIGRFMAPPAAVLINQPEVNPVGLEKVPAGLIVPALFRLTVTLSADVHARLDFLVRVRDPHDLLTDGDAFAPKPMAYAPK